jgi:hypothetical protein
MSSLLWIFGIFDAGALLMLLAELRTGRGLRVHVRPSMPAQWAIAIVVITYCAQLAISLYAALHQALPLPSRALIPLPLASAITTHQNAVVATMLLLAGLQTYALLALYRGRPSGRAVALASSVLVVASVLSPAMISADAYAYVADALLGLRAYAPPNVPFSGEFAPIGAWWSTPMPPTPYGPLWLLACRLVTGPFPSLLGKILALRLLGAGAFLALLGALRALGVPRRAIVVCALNPAVLFCYVASAHNDLLPVSMIAWAAYFSRRRPLLAAVLLAAGGLIKLPLAFFGLPVLAGITNRIARALLGACAIVIAAAGSYAIGGRGYLRAIALHVTSSPFMTVMTATVALAVIVAIVATPWSRRRYRSVVWLIPLSSAYTLSSYVAWSIPYALARRNVLGYLLIAFPVAAVLIDVKFMTPWTLFLVVPLVFVWQIVPLRLNDCR